MYPGFRPSKVTFIDSLYTHTHVPGVSKMTYRDSFEVFAGINETAGLPLTNETSRGSHLALPFIIVGN